MNIKEQINKNRELLFNILEELVSYNTINIPNENHTPFGKANKKCLDRILSLAESLGFKTKNLDNYCGYIEIGEGTDIIGIISHIDIVPAGNGWDTDPFVLTEKDDYLYGRGTSDDKGATAASLIALKIIKDLNVKLNKRIRLVIGCNEETGSKCIKYYNKKEPEFLYAFTPDGDFPCINGEKGQIACTFNCDKDSLIEIKGGNATNIVCDSCYLKLKSNSYDKESFIKMLESRKLKVTITSKDDIDEIIIIGKSSHASIPELGINAITNTMFALKEIGYKDNFINYYCDLFDLNNNGENIGINLNDKYGSLTMVNGTIKTREQQIIGTIDIRTPITINQDEIIRKINNKKIAINSISKPLYYSKESKLVTKLMKAYQTVTKDYTSLPKQIGGGTYAKNIKNCVAYGCEFSSDNNIHNVNERVKISELLLQVELYIYAIMELVK